MDFTQLKSQLITMFMLREANNVQNPLSNSSYNNIMTMIYTLFLITAIDYMTRSLPRLTDQVKMYVMRYIDTRQLKLLQNVPIPEEESNSITLRRSYEKVKGDENDIHVEKVDGVLEFICNLDAAKHIKLDRRYILNTKEEIQVTPHIRARITTMMNNEKGELSDLVIVLYSNTLKINDLRKWVDKIHSDFCFEKDNKLGKKKFFFNEIPVEPMADLPNDLRNPHVHVRKEKKKEYRWDTAPKTLTFTMNEFSTSKSFQNVFGSHVNELKERLDLFVNHPEWYEERGIPHSLGILLHGIPGAGKTSTIKAIAKDTNRHIFNLSLRPYTTQKQLTNLFYNENVMTMNDDGTKQLYRIPIHQRVFVIEDIDCLTNVVYQRTAESISEVNNTGDGITLSFLLNLLDGVLETPGRILVITSNYPEKLDTALVRPGRIDVRIKFHNASCELIADMINNFYKVSLTHRDIPSILDRALTPADVLESLCNNFKDHQAAIRELIRKAYEGVQKNTTEVPPNSLESESIPKQNDFYLSPNSSINHMNSNTDTNENIETLLGLRRDDIEGIRGMDQSIYGGTSLSFINGVSDSEESLDKFFKPL